MMDSRFIYFVNCLIICLHCAYGFPSNGGRENGLQDHRVRRSNQEAIPATTERQNNLTNEQSKPVAKTENLTVIRIPGIDVGIPGGSIQSRGILDGVIGPQGLLANLPLVGNILPSILGSQGMVLNPVPDGVQTILGNLNLSKKKALEEQAALEKAAKTQTQ